MTAVDGFALIGAKLCAQLSDSDNLVMGDCAMTPLRACITATVGPHGPSWAHRILVLAPPAQPTCT